MGGSGPQRLAVDTGDGRVMGCLQSPTTEFWPTNAYVAPKQSTSSVAHVWNERRGLDNCRRSGARAFSLAAFGSVPPFDEIEWVSLANHPRVPAAVR